MFCWYIGDKSREQLTIILWNRADYSLVLSRRGSRLRWLSIRQYSARLSRIIVLLFNKLITKLVIFLNFSVDIFSPHFFFPHTKLHISPDICYLRMTDIRASWPYLDSVTICWIIKRDIHRLSFALLLHSTVRVYAKYVRITRVCVVRIQYCAKVMQTIIDEYRDTVPLKSKLTLETRTSRLDPRASMLETFEDRVSSIESRVPRIEKQGFLEYAKTRKGFEKTIYFSKEE